MNALVRKELRQVLPAQLLITALFTVAWLLVDPSWALAPYAEEQFSLYAYVELFCFLEGLALAMAQFGMERWRGTEAYLVHRGTGRRGAFRAKALAGLTSLAPLAIVPPALYGAFYLLTQDHAGTASVLSLVQAALAGLAVVPGYALGVFMAQVRRGWILRAALAFLGALTLLFALTLLVIPSTLFVRWPVAWHLLIALGVGVWLLFLAGQDFELGEHFKGSRPIALVHALTATALCLPFFIFVPFAVRVFLRIDVMAGLPHVVEDGQGRLFVATATERDRGNLLASYPGIPRIGQVYQLVDAEGGSVPDDVGLHYNGWRSYFDDRSKPIEDRPRFTTLYAPFWTQLTQVPETVRRTNGRRNREPLALSGPWHSVQDQPVGWHVLVDLSDGTLWVRPWSASPRPWCRLATLGPSIRVLEGERDNDLALCDEATGLLLTLRNQEVDEVPVLESAPLPDGDRFVGIEPLYSANAARIGVQVEEHGELVRGTKALYTHSRDNWLKWDELESSERKGRASAGELGELRRWTLIVSPLHGTGIHLDVLDAASGETRLAVDLAPTPQRQGSQALFVDPVCLALPPAVVIASWSSPQRAEPEAFGFIGPTLVEELRGRNRTWIVLVSMLVAVAFTRNLWRRLSQGGAPLDLRLWWCGATAFLGLPAYVLCRVLEPRAARAPRPAVPIERREPRLVIRTT